MTTPRARRAASVLLVLLTPLSAVACGDEGEDPPANFESEKRSPKPSDSLPDTRTTLSDGDQSDGSTDGLVGD